MRQICVLLNVMRSAREEPEALCGRCGKHFTNWKLDELPAESMNDPLHTMRPGIEEAKNAVGS